MIFVLTCTEDGDKYLLTFKSREAFLSSVNSGDFGDDAESMNFLSEPPGRSLDYTVGHIAIEGNIIVPKPKQTVTEWSL